MLDCPQCVPDLEIQQAGSDVLVHDVVHRKIHVINGTAACVLQLCDGEHDVSSLVDGVAEAFGVERERVAGDVETILGEFERIGLLEVR